MIVLGGSPVCRVGRNSPRNLTIRFFVFWGVAPVGIPVDSPTRVKPLDRGSLTNSGGKP